MINDHPAHRSSMMEQISHELRTPLAGILGMAHILQKTPLNSEQKEYLNDIVVSAKSLLTLENTLHLILKNNQSAVL